MAFTLVFFEGDVIKTRSGGQAVQFTDIETLKQERATVPRYHPAADDQHCCNDAFTFFIFILVFAAAKENHQRTNQ